MLTDLNHRGTKNTKIHKNHRTRARDWLTAWLCAVGDFEVCHSESDILCVLGLAGTHA